MFNEFLINSLTKYNEFEVVSSTGKQHSNDGNYFSKGFNETTKDKIIFLLNVLENSVNEDEFVLFSDVDVIFLKPIQNYLSQYFDYDIVFQNGFGGLNTGFFLLKNNKDVKELLQDVINNCHLYDNDQITLNNVIPNHNIKFGIFGNEISSPAHIIGPTIWNGEHLKIPTNTIVFHACWCEGTDNKIKLLDYVRNYK
jgi:hypothetical protein